MQEPLIITINIFTIIFVLISVIIGAKLISNYFEMKHKVMLTVGLTWILLVSSWFDVILIFIVRDLYGNDDPILISSFRILDVLGSLAIFFWIYNCSFVNEDLSGYYDAQHSGAFVDGVIMWKNSTEFCLVEVLFAPWESDTIGTGEITNSTFNTLSGALVDDAIGNMPDATESGWGEFPIDFVIDVFFQDGTFFCLMFWTDTGLCNIYNGTWDGFTEYGWPNITNYFEGYYLQENGLLDAPKAQFFSAITGAVSYPE